MYKHNWDIICVLLITLQNVFVSVMLEKKLKPFFFFCYLKHKLQNQIKKQNIKKSLIYTNIYNTMCVLVCV